MKQQVFVIHGGNAFETHEEYVAYLRAKEVSLEKLLHRDWKANLQKSLGDDFEVYMPSMPSKNGATFFEWVLWFEKYIPFMGDEVILVGHSLGGSFLAKYLSEVSFPKKIRGTFLVAAPYDMDEGRKLPEFSVTTSLKKLEDQAGELFIYQSKDDPVVAFSELEKYQKELPKATFRIFEDRQHFNQEEFPEIVEDIRGL